MRHYCSSCEKVTHHDIKPSGAFIENGIDRAIVALFTLGISEASRETDSFCEECGSKKSPH